MQGRAHLCICCANTSVRRALRPLPEPSWRTAKTPPSPASWLAMSVGVLEHSGAGKIPMSETMGIERLGRFPAGCQVQRGGGMGVKNYTSISCHSFLPSPPPPVAEHAKQLAQDAQQGADQIKVVEHGGSPMMRNWTASSGQGGGGYMTGFAARAVPETGPLMTTPARSFAPGFSAA
jgi:hypothetical protein